MADNATLQVPKDVLEPIIQAEVTKAILEAMKGRDALVSKAINFFMNVGVDNEGKVSNYGSSTPWIQWAVMRAVQDAAKDALAEYMAAHKEEMKKQLLAKLREKNSPVANNLVAAIMQGITDPETLKWRFTVQCDKKNY